MHKVIRIVIEDISSPRVLFTHTHKLDRTDITIKKVNLTETPKTMTLHHCYQPSHHRHTHRR